MRNNRKLAGLLLVLLTGAIVSVTWCRRDRTGDGSTSTAATGGVSSPMASPALSGAPTEGPTRAAPPVELPTGGIAQSTSGEGSKPIGADQAKTMPGGAQPKAPGASHAKRKDAEPQMSASAVAQRQGESSDRVDAGTRAEPPPEAALPPKEMGMLVGRIHNSAGSTFRLTKVSFFVEGSPVAAQDFPTGLEANADVQVFERRVDLGNHTLRAVLEYQGNGAGGLSYFEGYRYKVSSSHDVTVTANASSQITVVSYEKGGLLTPFENRLGVAFRVSTANNQ